MAHLIRNFGVPPYRLSLHCPHLVPLLDLRFRRAIFQQSCYQMRARRPRPRELSWICICHGLSILPITRCCFAMLHVSEGLSRSSWATNSVSPPGHTGSIPSNLILLTAGHSSITVSVLHTMNPSVHVQPPDNSDNVPAMLLKYSNECTTTYAHVGELPKV